MSIRIQPTWLLLITLSACSSGATGPSTPPPVTPPPSPAPPAPPAPVAVASIGLSVGSASVQVGETTTLTATPRDASGSPLAGRAVTWSSTSPGIATVSNGIVTGVSAGTATISATSEGKVAAAEITVTAVPALSCASQVTTGRLTRPTPGGPYIYTTLAGWTVQLTTTWILTMTEPQGRATVEWWGMPFNNEAMSQENLNGKHIKNWYGSRRSMELPGGVLITVQAGGTPATGHVSIYEGNESHRIELPTFNVVRSCALPRFEEDLEHDGEASRLSDDGTGFVYEGIYTQGASGSGSPLPKVLQLVPFGRTYFAEPNRVTDFHDDPRIGHT